MPVFNVRVPPWLKAMVEEASDLAGMKTSRWARDALEAGARKEIYEARRAAGQVPHTSGRSLGGGFVTQGRCTHPPTARLRDAQFEWCGLCKVVTKDLM